MSQQLSTRAKNLLLPDKRVKNKIAEAVKETPLTVHAWVAKDNPLIIQPAALAVIQKEYGLTQKEAVSNANA